MKKSSRIIFFLLIISLSSFTITSCEKLLLRITGNYKTPREQDSLSILNFVRSKNAYYDQLYVFKSKVAYHEYFHEHPELPGNLIYNSEKKLLHPTNNSTCPWSAYYSLIDTSLIIQSIKFKPDSIITNKELINDVLEKLKPVDIKESNEIYEYYIISVWAKFTPKFTKQAFNDLYRFKCNPNKKICVILVNADIQSDW